MWLIHQNFWARIHDFSCTIDRKLSSDLQCKMLSKIWAKNGWVWLKRTLINWHMPKIWPITSPSINLLHLGQLYLIIPVDLNIPCNLMLTSFQTALKISKMHKMGRSQFAISLFCANLNHAKTLRHFHFLIFFMDFQNKCKFPWLRKVSVEDSLT